MNDPKNNTTGEPETCRPVPTTDELLRVLDVLDRLDGRGLITSDEETALCVVSDALVALSEDPSNWHRYADTNGRNTLTERPYLRVRVMHDLPTANVLDRVGHYLTTTIKLPYGLVLPPHEADRRDTLCGFDGDASDTNGQRACAARRTLPNADDSSVSDAVVNLLHLAHSRGEDPLAVVRRGLRDFLMEAARESGSA